MKNFEYARAESVKQAAILCAEMDTKAIAGGTNLIDLMKLQVETPSRLIDLNSLGDRGIEELDGGLRIGALASNTAVAVDMRIRADYPVRRSNCATRRVSAAIWASGRAASISLISTSHATNANPARVAAR